MNSVSYDDVGYTIPADYATSHSRFWQRLQSSGSWFSSAERVAIAQAVRDARDCPLCQKRVQALSPHAVKGVHVNPDRLKEPVIESIHSIVNHASRLTNPWYEQLLASGLTDGEYIEIVGTVVSMVSIDSFTDALGLSRRELPECSDQSPSGYRPSTAIESDQAWVPMIPVDNADTPEADLWPAGRTGNVVRAMSLVPDEVRTLKDLSAAHYLPMHLVRQQGVDAGRALNRTQIELVAGRVSALNACYYWTTAHASMLRASSETHEQSINLESIMDGGSTGDIPHGLALSEFASAIVNGDTVRITETREALIEAAGRAAMVDAAGVASNFQRMTRIADSTGIVLGDFEVSTAELRHSLGIDAFKSA